MENITNLPRRGMSRFASPASPERERRLLFFAAEKDDQAESKEEDEKKEDKETDKENEVKKQQDETKQDVKEAMETPEPVDASKLNVEILNYTKRIGNFEKNFNWMTEIINNVYSDEEKEEELKGLREYRGALRATVSNIGVLQDTVQVISKWRQDDYTPIQYIDALNSTRSTAGIEEIEPTQEMRWASENWETLTDEEKKLYKEECDKLIGTNDILKKTKEQMDKLHEELDEAFNTFDEMKKIDPGKEEGPEKVGMLTQLKNMIPGRWYSLKQIGMGFKKYYDAFLKAQQQWNERKSSTFAKGVGDMLEWMPYGRQVSTVLDTEVENKHTEEKDEHMKFLEARNYQFEASLDELRNQEGQENKMRAVIEYMAQNGWLYDFDREGRKVFGYEIAMPSSWNEPTKQSYMIQLNLKYSEGQDKMKKRGEDLVSTAESIPPIVKELESELALKNYWSTFGLLKVAYDKGKIGESGTWIATTILRHLRDDPSARKYMPKDLFDQLGNLGISHPAWTNTFFKVNRNQLEEFKKIDDPERFDEAGELAAVIQYIEEDFEKELGSSWAQKQPKEKNQLIAKVLAAQVVTEGGKTFSIFDDRYQFYREKISQLSTTTDVGKADDDFYGNISDALLATQTTFNAILGFRTGGGNFDHEVKAKGYLRQILDLNDQLASVQDREFHKNYQLSVRQKFDSYFREQIISQDVIKRWNVLRIPGTDTELIHILKQRGLISEDVYSEKVMQKTPGKQ